MGARKAKHGWILTIFFTVVSLLYVYPILLIYAFFLNELITTSTIG